MNDYRLRTLGTSTRMIYNGFMQQPEFVFVVPSPAVATLLKYCTSTGRRKFRTVRSVLEVYYISV